VEEQFVDEDPDPVGDGSAEYSTRLPGLCALQAACDALHRWTQYLSLSRAGSQSHMRVVGNALDLPGGRPGRKVRFAIGDVYADWSADFLTIAAVACQHGGAGSVQRRKYLLGYISHAFDYSSRSFTRIKRSMQSSVEKRSGHLPRQEILRRKGGCTKPVGFDL
jgi:hypothetical protein